MDCTIYLVLIRLRPISTYEPRHEKPNVLVSYQVTHKLGCTATEDGFRKKRDFTIYVAKTKALISFFVFAHAKRWFSHDAAHIVKEGIWSCIV